MSVALCNKLLSHLVISVTLCYNFLSYFVIMFSKFVKLFLFVTLNILYQKSSKKVSEFILSQFVIKTVIAKNLDNVQILTVFYFQNC